MTIKQILAITLPTVLSASVAFTQAPQKSDKEDRIKQDLMQIERDIGKANVAGDAAFFERVEADEFIFTDAGGGVTNKKEDLDSLKQPANPDAKLVSYDVDDMNVRLYDKVAVVTGRVTTKRLVKGQSVTGQSRFTDVFVWRDQRWQIVAGHSSRIRTP